MENKSTLNEESQGSSIDAMAHSSELFSGNPELSKRMKLIDSEIEKFINDNMGEPKVLYEAAMHLLRAGGKRLRSLLCMLSCEAVGGSIERILPYAVAAELLQTASLLHDDVIDDDTLRRGVATAHKKYGSRIAVLAGDLLVAQAVKMVSDDADAESLRSLSALGIAMCEGEATDYLLSTRSLDTYGKDEYLQMIEQKTASFMKGAVKIGAIVGGGTNEQVDVLVEYARNIGMAFQIRDDTLDIISSNKELGKPVLSDILKKRSNFVLLEALDSSSLEERKRVIEELEAGNIKIVLDFVEATQSIHEAIKKTESYIEAAKKSLSEASLHTEDLLLQLADYISIRRH